MPPTRCLYRTPHTVRTIKTPRFRAHCIIMITGNGMSWRQLREDVQKKFSKMYPGPLPSALIENRVGHVQMLIYLELHALGLANMADVSIDHSASFDRKDGKAFHQITRVVVPMRHRWFFNQMAVPPISACRGWLKNDRKCLRSSWHAAGFVEHVDRDRNVVLTFSRMTRAKAVAHTESMEMCKVRREMWVEIPDGELIDDHIEYEVMNF